jgi:hypothetical protein
MPRLYLFAEGQTEQTFADVVLSPHLANHGVFLHGTVLVAHAKKKGRIHRGGGRNYPPMKNDILRFMKQERGNDVFFTTMIDLYAIPNDFPGLDTAEKLRHIPYDRVQSLQTAWGSDVSDSRFIPFIQLHEFEAYLFVAPQELGLFYPRSPQEIERLEQIALLYDSPELIDDGQATAPSKRIIDVFPDYEKAKRTIGPQVAELIGIEAIRRKCPHFDRWLTTLEKLAS